MVDVEGVDHSKKKKIQVPGKRYLERPTVEATVSE